MLKGIVAIEKKLVYPFAFVIQPLTGVLLIFESGRNHNFFNYEWLWVGIILYIIAFYAAVFVQTPALDKMIELAEAGNAGVPEPRQEDADLRASTDPIATGSHLPNDRQAR